MDDFTLSVDTTQWEALLADLPKRVRRRAVRSALQAAGDVLRDAIETEAPERTDVPTPGSDALPPGILKADISTQVQVGTKYDPRVKVGPTAIAGRVARWVENGFDHVSGGASEGSIAFKTKYGIGGTRKLGTKGEHIDANPFMARGFDASIGQAVDAMLGSLATSLGQDINTPSGGEESDD